MAHWALLFMGILQEYWSRLLCPPPRDLSKPGIEPRSPTLQADFLPSDPPGMPMNTEMGSLSFLLGLGRIELGFPSLQVDSLPAEPLGKPKNIGMDSLALLQQIFLTQELN